MSEEEEFLVAARASAREEERFFSNTAKPERELWVARELVLSSRISDLGGIGDIITRASVSNHEDRGTGFRESF